MTCETIQHELMELAARSGDLAGPLARHVSECAACGDAWADLGLCMAALETLPLERPGAGLAETVRRRILRELGAARRWHVPGELGLAIGFGLLSSLVSLAVLGFRIDLTGQPAWVTAAGGLAWAGVFVLAYWMLLRPRSGEDDFRALVVSGLGAMAFFMVADQLLPLTGVVQFCYTSSWGREHLGVLGLKGLFFAVGAVYALVPLFLLSLATGKRVRSGALRGGVVAGGMFFFLLAPAIFIQCASFTAGALFAWLGGATVGSTAGGVAGYWVYRQAFAPRA